MANDLDQSLFGGAARTSAERINVRSIAHRSRGCHAIVRPKWTALLFLAITLTLTIRADADAWLDRVERNLQRINSASQYTEPAGVGSKAATKVHRACIHKGDKDACEQLIWRRPELLPIRDWAVGTAHIKRGEIREKSGNVTGALEDYRDALGYHSFSNLAARIKRLELRQRRDAEAAAKAEAERAADVAQNKKDDTTIPSQTSPGEAQGEQTSAASNTGINEPPLTNGNAPGHSVVAVGGWAATIAGQETAKADADSPASSIAPGQENADGGSNTKGNPDQHDDGGGAPTSLASTGVASTQRELSSPEIMNGSQQTATFNDPPSPSLSVGRSDLSANPMVSARFIPGQGLALIDKISSQHAKKSDVIPTPSVGIGKDAPRGAGLTQSRNPSNDETGASFPDKLQFNVSEEVARSLERVRRKANDVITTASLPDRKRNQSGYQHRSAISLAVVLTLTLMFFSTAALAVGWRPSFPSLLPRKERKPVLSVDDLETLIKERTGEGGRAEATKSVPRPPMLQDPTKVTPQADRTNAVPKALPQNAESDKKKPPQAASQKKEPNSAPKKEDCEQGRRAENTPVVQAGAKRETGTKSQSDTATDLSELPHQNHQSAPKFNVDDLDASLLRRVSYGAASLIVVAGPRQTSSDAIVAKVESARQAEFLERRVNWTVEDPTASGVLNPFAARRQIGGDPLAERHRFNAAFELHCSIFESLFGARFVYDQKVMLRHMMLVLQTLPNVSLKTFYTLLESPRSLEPLRDALAEIDNVSTRLFFTTVFASEEFSDTAEYMRKCLAPVLEHDLVAHLCCGQPASDPFQSLSIDGCWTLLSLDPAKLGSEQSTVLVRCLLSVLAMQSWTADRSTAPEIATTLFAPNLSAEIGGTATDAAFLIDQVQRAGYAVLSQ